MSKLIRKATIDDVVHIATSLLPEDEREIVEGMGLNPVLSISLDIHTSDSVVFFTPDSTYAGIAGVSPDGCIWMHCTPAVKSIPLFFCKEARLWIDGLHHPLLYNCADIRNTLHLKLLKHLGFKFLTVRTLGPYDRYFVEFVRL